MEGVIKNQVQNYPHNFATNTYFYVQEYSFFLFVIELYINGQNNHEVQQQLRQQKSTVLLVKCSACIIKIFASLRLNTNERGGACKYVVQNNTIYWHTLFRNLFKTFFVQKRLFQEERGDYKGSYKKCYFPSDQATKRGVEVKGPATMKKRTFFQGKRKTSPNHFKH